MKSQKQEHRLEQNFPEKNKIFITANNLNNKASIVQRTLVIKLVTKTLGSTKTRALSTFFSTGVGTVNNKRILLNKAK